MGIVPVSVVHSAGVLRNGAGVSGVVGSLANIGGIWDELAAGRLTVIGQELDSASVRLRLRFGPASNVTAGHQANIETLKSVLIGRPQKILALQLGIAASTISSRGRTALVGMGAPSSLRRAPLALAMLAAVHDLGLEPVGAGYRLTSSATGTELEISMPRPELAFRARLTPAELDVVRAIMAGASQRQVGNQRERSARTIANQMAAISEKLRASGRFGFIRLAVAMASGSPRLEH